MLHNIFEHIKYFFCYIIYCSYFAVFYAGYTVPSVLLCDRNSVVIGFIKIICIGFVDIFCAL